MKPTVHFHIAPTLSMSGAIPPLFHIPAWSAQRQLYLCLTFDRLHEFLTDKKPKGQLVITLQSTDKSQY
jgi:hypothetical protein